jgi:POT family proton-dependent oligopeptide transporter
MFRFITTYFAEFKILKNVSKDFWLVNAIQFFDGLAYFSMITILSLYLTDNCGFSDMEAGAWTGIYTLFVTAFILAIGSIIDVIGINRSFLVGVGALAVARLGLGIGPFFLKGEELNWAVRGLVVIMAFGTAYMSPVVNTALRRFTDKTTRGTGFNMYYLIMNIGAILAGVGVIDIARDRLGPLYGNMAVMDFGFAMSIICLVISRFINEHNYASEEERVDPAKAAEKRPLQIFAEVWKESAFQKLVMFLLLTIGVRLVFTHQFLVMPKYYTRVLYSDFDLGAANSLNPLIIVLGLIVLIPVINRFSTVSLMIWGMTISAASLLFMAVPIDWYLGLPGINNITDAYFFVIIAQIFVFAFGELLFSPRFVEYTASVAPKDKVASYMALSALPMFIAKPINGFVSGLLISSYSYDGIRAKIDSHNISYSQSPEWMWMIFFLVAAVSPIAIALTRKSITSETPRAESH